MTAENGGTPYVVGERGPASMRPRPMTAENVVDDDGNVRLRTASMRPRPMTAENDGAYGYGISGELASMRPRPMTAENRPVVDARRELPDCFNEAAADDRGKLQMSRMVECTRNGALQ